MELFGYPMQTIYLAVLIISGILVFIFILFGDIFEALDGLDDVPFLSPILILSFLVFMSAIGFIFEWISSIHSFIILAIAAVSAFILTTLLNVFVLVPLSSAEESLTLTDNSLRGRLGKTIISIPKDGFGEVMIESVSGSIAKSAQSFDGNEIAEGTTVLVVQVKKGVLQVIPYDEKKIYQLSSKQKADGS